MKPALALLLAVSALTVAAAPRASAADDAAAVKLPEPKPLTAGHKVVTLFPPGHPALKAGPGSDREEEFKEGGDGRVQAVTNIHNPSIELYLAPPDKANGTSVILSPGGGNNTCNVGGEGVDAARWLNGLGVSCFVHRYRLKPYGSATDALADTQRAVRVVRANAKEWNIDPNKIGHMGFSAGGEQTARLALTFDAGKPDVGRPDRPRQFPSRLGRPGLPRLAPRHARHDEGPEGRPADVPGLRRHRRHLPRQSKPSSSSTPSSMPA